MDGQAPRREIDALRFTAVVLAAGAGRRFGGAKLTAPWRGGVLLDGALAAAFAAPVAEVIVVTGSNPAVGPAADAFAARREESGRLRIATAAGWTEGLAASLRAGLREVPAGREGAFIFLGDMPELPHGLADTLAQAFLPHVAAVAPMVGQAPGHPVLLGRRLFGPACALTGDRGAQSLLAGPDVIRVPVDAPGATLDIDTPEALANLILRR